MLEREKGYLTTGKVICITVAYVELPDYSHFLFRTLAMDKELLIGIKTQLASCLSLSFNQYGLQCPRQQNYDNVIDVLHGLRVLMELLKLSLVFISSFEMSLGVSLNCSSTMQYMFLS